MNTEWTALWPTESGQYWFYGWMWCDKEYTDMIKRAPQLNLIDVRKTGSGVMYIAHGNFIYARDRHVGLWLNAVIDNLPDLNDLNDLKEQIYNNK